MKISVIIPTYNECKTIGVLLKNIFALKTTKLEVIVVDDSSADGTIDIVRGLRKEFPVTIIVRPKKSGLGSALKDGLFLARAHGAEVAVTMDADLSHNPACIPAMIARIEQGADLVIGSRRVPGGAIHGWGFTRTAMSRGAMEFARRTLGIVARDVTSGFRAYRRRVLEIIDLSEVSSTGYAFQEEMLYRAQRAGLRIKEIPIVFKDRTHGKSKLGMRDIFEFFVTVIRLKFTV